MRKIGMADARIAPKPEGAARRTRRRRRLTLGNAGIGVDAAGAVIAGIAQWRS